jgi:ABC-2 type transport system ATP-binding protein
VVRDFLRSLAAEGRTILISSHVLAEVAQTVDDVVIIAHGKLVVEAPMEPRERTNGSVSAFSPRSSGTPRSRRSASRCFSALLS